MSDAIIRVEGIGKKYRIRHERTERYTALRDVIAAKARGLFIRSKPGAGGGSNSNNSNDVAAASRKDITETKSDFSSGSRVSEAPSVEDFWALRDVSFEVKRGEVVGIIGRNGAGKSTLLKILSRITEPTEGRVELDGRVASLLEVGTGFHPELTGRENIFLNGAILGMTRAEIRRKFDEIVAFAEVEKFLDTPVKRYSSGMYVRLAFSVAAHLEPEILVVDEVLAVGDAEFQKKCLGKMHEVSKGGRTVLFVSHNMSAVRKLCTRGLLLRGGSVVLDGYIADIIQHYASISNRAYSITFAEGNAQPSITRIDVDQQALANFDLVLDIEFSSPWPLRPPIGGVVLRSLTGEPIWGSNGRFHECVEQGKALMHGRLRCEARGLPIVEGDYLLSVWLADWNQDHDARVDVLNIRLGNDQANPLRPSAAAIGHLDWPAVWHACADGAHAAN